MQINRKIVFTGLVIFLLIVPVLGIMDNDSITPSARRGAKILPDAAKSGIGGIIDLAMYIVAIVAILAALYAAAIAFFSKDANKKNEGVKWLGYIVLVSILLGIVFAIINSTLYS